MAGIVVKEGTWYRAVDPDGGLRSLVDGLAALGERFLADEEPSRQSLDYLARRMTSLHHETLAGLAPRSLTVTIGSLTVGCRIGEGCLVFAEPRTGDTHVYLSPGEFLRLATGADAPEILDGELGSVDLLRFLSSAA